MQKWEYKIITIIRGLQDYDNRKPKTLLATDWVGWWENADPLPTPVALLKKITDLGSVGWELVAVTPTSDYQTSNYAGLTTSELWTFKRPIEDE